MNSKVFPNCSHAKSLCSHILAEVVDLIGRHEETRTPDLYRVKLLVTFIINNLHGTGRDCKPLKRQTEHNKVALLCMNCA